MFLECSMGKIEYLLKNFQKIHENFSCINILLP